MGLVNGRRGSYRPRVSGGEAHLLCRWSGVNGRLAQRTRKGRLKGEARGNRERAKMDDDR